MGHYFAVAVGVAQPRHLRDPNRRGAHTPSRHRSRLLSASGGRRRRPSQRRHLDRADRRRRASASPRLRSPARRAGERRPSNPRVAGRVSSAGDVLVGEGSRTGDLRNRASGRPAAVALRLYRSRIRRGRSARAPLAVRRPGLRQPLAVLVAERGRAELWVGCASGARSESDRTDGAKTCGRNSAGTETWVLRSRAPGRLPPGL